MDPIDKWKLLSSKMALDNRWFKVRQDKVQLPNGKILDDYFVWESGDVAMVVSITSDNKIVLVKQYKHGSQQIMIECPAGYTNDSEDPLLAAKRELVEETGYEIKTIEPLAKLINAPTKENGIIHVFLARVGKKVIKQNLDVSEEIEILEVPVPDVLKMIENGEIWATASISAIFISLNKLGLPKR